MPSCDADLQHDEKLLAEMLRLIRTGEFDIVVASRFKDADRVEGLSAARERMSRIGNWVSRKVCKADLSDPLSGFFMLRRRTLEDVVYSLSNLGFKILVDIFASSSKPLRCCELGFTFRNRQHGESKLDSAAMTEFGLLLCDKTLGKYIPTRFVAFLAVGVIGVVLHLTLLALLFKLLSVPFLKSQVAATVAAIFGNYYFNNELTYRDLRLKGRNFWAGLAGFSAVCATGAWINYVLARDLYDGGALWLLAGAAGALLGGVWNYTLTSFFVWRTRATPRRVPDVEEILVTGLAETVGTHNDGLKQLLSGLRSLDGAPADRRPAAAASLIGCAGETIVDGEFLANRDGSKAHIEDVALHDAAD